MIQRNSPELFVRDVDEALRFYRDVLGFEVEGRMPEDNSQPVEWAMVKSGAAAFMFGGNRVKPGSQDVVVFYLAVENVDQTIHELHSRVASLRGQSINGMGCAKRPSLTLRGTSSCSRQQFQPLESRG